MTDRSTFHSSTLPEYKDLDTMFSLLINSIRLYGNNYAYIYNLGEIEHRVTYSKLFEDVLILARAFRKNGMRQGDKAMVLSDNRYAWIVTDLALMSFGAVSVPRGSDTPTEELQFIMEHSESTFLVMETESLYKSHSDFLRTCHQVQSVFVMTGSEGTDLPPNVSFYNALLGDRQYTSEDIQHFLQLGEQINGETLLTIIYTSGTTGRPKGVLLDHGNIMHNVNVIPDLIQLRESDNWLSILPSWHIFERTAEYVALARGTALVYSSIRRFAQDLEKYKPTLVATVPRVWETLYGKVEGTVRKKGGVAEKLFRTMIWASTSYRRNKRKAMGRMPVFQSNWKLTQWLATAFAIVKMTLLFPLYKISHKKLEAVRQRFGGRLRLAISGGGTLASYLEEWIDAVGIRIVNAYGMTECSPAIAGRGLNCRVFGTVGPPVPHTELRVVSIEGKSLPAGQEGTIEVRGDQVTQGYYNNPGENEKSFTGDGFFKTGDLGKMTLSGELVITGRAKEIIVLSNGENVDPTKIENAITKFPFVEDAVLVGQDKKGLGALLVPNLEELKAYLCGKLAGFTKEKEVILTDRKVLDIICEDINRILKPKMGFKPYEKLQNITFLDRQFRLGEELTNTLKKKRHIIETKYKALINDLLV